MLGLVSSIKSQKARFEAAHVQELSAPAERSRHAAAINGRTRRVFRWNVERFSIEVNRLAALTV